MYGKLFTCRYLLRVARRLLCIASSVLHSDYGYKKKYQQMCTYITFIVSLPVSHLCCNCVNKVRYTSAVFLMFVFIFVL